MLAGDDGRADAGDAGIVDDAVDMLLNAGNQIGTGAYGTADQEGLGIEDVLDIVDGPGQMRIHIVDIAAGLVVAFFSHLEDDAAVQFVAGDIASLGNLTDKRAGAAALTEDILALVYIDVAEFAAMQVGTMDDFLVMDEGSADAGTEYEEGDVLIVAACAGPNLAESGAVGIILHGDGQFEHSGQGVADREIVDIGQSTAAADDAILIVDSPGQAEAGTANLFAGSCQFRRSQHTLCCCHLHQIRENSSEPLLLSYCQF